MIWIEGTKIYTKVPNTALLYPYYRKSMGVATSLGKISYKKQPSQISKG